MRGAFSFIPESTWARLSDRLSLPSPAGYYSNKSLPRLGALVIDVCGLRSGPSHFGLPQAIETSRRLGARKTYFTDIGHLHSHEAYLAFSLAFERHATSSAIGIETNNRAVVKHEALGSGTPLWRIRTGHERRPAFEHVYEAIDFRVDDLELWAERGLEAVEEWAGGAGPGSWTRPAADGMTVSWEQHRPETAWSSERVWDDEYE